MRGTDETKMDSDDDTSFIPDLNSDTDDDKENVEEEEMARIILNGNPRVRDEILGNQVRAEDCVGGPGFRGRGEIRVNRLTGNITDNCSERRKDQTKPIAKQISHIENFSIPISPLSDNLLNVNEFSLISESPFCDISLRQNVDEGRNVVDGDEGLEADPGEEAVALPETNSSVNVLNFCELSRVSEGDFICDDNEREKEEKDNELRFYYANCRGFSSKKESIQQIVNELDSDICILTETNFKGNAHPKLPNMHSFFRNREMLHMGGVAVLVNDKFRNYSVKTKTGGGGNEFLVIRFSCFEPKLAVVAMYGAQKSEGVRTVMTNVHEIFYEIKECQAAGYSVVLVGDTNLQLGRELIDKNDICVTKAGSLFNDYSKECGLKFANNLSDNPGTFVKDNLSRVLDVVGVENMEMVSEFNTDSEEMLFTPFKIRNLKSGAKRVYSDHRALHWKMKVKFTKPPSRLPPVWRLNRPLGDQRFDVVTDAGAEWMIDLCENEENIDKVVEKVDKFIHKSKFTAYGKITSTRKKKEKWDEKRMWAARLELVHKIAQGFEKDRDNVRIWRARNVAMEKSDNQTTSLKDYRTGEMLDDLDAMTEMLLDYNEETMGKEIPTPEIEMLRGMKESVVDDLLSDVSEFPQHISWEVYMKVMKKIMKQKKGVLRDFIKSGPAFKIAVFILLNRIYSQEKEPKIFKKTWLTKIWKRKGSVSEIGNNRFVHGRHWLGKIYEKCLVEIISEDQIRETPDFQMGGIPGKSTREHLLAAMIMIKNFNNKGKSVPVILCDVKKCFDKLILSDLVYDSALTGADLKAVKMLRNFHQDFEIMMAGDMSKNPKSRVIPRTAGQGTNAAPGWAGNSQAQTIKKNVNFRLCAKVGEVQTGPKAFVDDVFVAPGSAEEARQMGPQLTRAFDELSIKIHEKKTVIIAPGGTMEAKKMREDLEKNPMMIQGNPIKIAESDSYLGMVIHQNGVKDSIVTTFNQRKGKAWAQVPAIKSLIHHPQLLNEGWLGAAVSIIQGIIPATMLYSCEAWIDMSKGFLKNVEKEYKAMVYAVLEIPTHTLYAAVLAETGLMKIKHMIERARLCYANQVIWKMEGSEVHKLLMEDLKMRGEESHLGKMKVVAESYGLPDLIQNELDTELVKEKIRQANDDELLREVWGSRAAEKRVWLRLRVKPHFKWPKNEARARILEAAGGFRFLAQSSGWKAYYRARQISTNCVSRLCKEEDTMAHAKICPFMNTRWSDKYDEDKKLKAEYFSRLSKERRRRFGYPIL